jgi:hypothetical protein
MSKPLFAAFALAVTLSGCAGRPPAPVQVVQTQDQYANCAAIMAEVQADNQRISELGSEQGAKVAQNVVAGVAGLFIPVLWFGMDFQGAAGTEQAALQSRQQYLASLAQERCRGQAARPPVVPGNIAGRT